jgi:hypothetical protein
VLLIAIFPVLEHALIIKRCGGNIKILIAIALCKVVE